MTNLVFIALGGNLPSAAGQPRETCTAALQMLAEEGVEVGRRSSWYSTVPVPASDQPWFTNAVVCARTSLSPEALLALLHQIEARFGRVREVQNGARTLDLDLLTFGDLIRAENAPLLPHPRLQERVFVLQPLAEIAPDWVHPALGRSAAELLAALPDQSGIRREP